MRPIAPIVLLAFALACAPRVLKVPSAAVPALDHVVVVVLENQPYERTRVQPGIASLAAGGATFARSYAVTHPSQPNYLALWAGSTLGVRTNTCPAPGSPFSAENLGHACEKAGLTWRAYVEDLPAPGSAVCEAKRSLYTRKHCPWTHFANLDHRNERPFGELARDLARGTLPNLAFVIPNNCHNAHNPGCTLAEADAWLARELPAILAALGPRGLLVLTWDEDDHRARNHILTVFRGPLVDVGRVSNRFVTHYTVLRTLCDALGLPAFGRAVVDSAITDVWRAGAAARPPSTAAGAWLGAPEPNPTKGDVSAELRLPEAVAIEAAVYDTLGRTVRRLAAGRRQGSLRLTWDGRDAEGRDVGAGLFFLRVRTGTTALQQKIARLK